MHQRRGLGLRLVIVAVVLGLSPAALAQPTHDGVLQFFVPYINSFYLQPDGEPDAKVNTGFWGFGMGLTIRHAASQHFGFTARVATDFPVPVIGAVDFYGEQEFMTTYTVDLANHHVRGRFSLGYGLSYSANRWELKFFDDPEGPPPTRDPVARRSESLGLVFPAGYTLNERFALGLVYRPSLYRLGEGAGFLYEHVVSVDIVWNLGLF